MNKHQKPAQFHLKESTNFQEATDKTENQHESINTEKKLSPRIPAPSSFTQPVWRGSKITGNISVKVAIWDAVGKRKCWCVYKKECKEPSHQHKAKPLSQPVSCTESLQFCLKNYKEEAEEYWKDNMGGER